MGLPADITILNLHHLYLLIYVSDVRKKFYCIRKQYHIFVFDLLQRYLTYFTLYYNL